MVIERRVSLALIAYAPRITLPVLVWPADLGTLLYSKKWWASLSLYLCVTLVGSPGLSEAVVKSPICAIGLRNRI